MNKDIPLISIIIPVYNTEKYLADCLESIIQEEFKNYEIIIINDGSTDNSQIIIDKYLKKYKNIISIKRENRGLLYTRIEGVKNASGKYIMFIDSDDWIPKGTLKLFENILKENDYDIIRGNYTIICKNDKHFIKELKNNIITHEKLNEKLYKNLMLSDAFNSACRQIIKKDIIDINHIRTDVCMGEDIIFNLGCYKNINIMKTISENVYNYRFNNSSITKTLTKERLTNNLKDLFKVYEELVNGMLQYGNAKNVKLAYIRYLKKANFAFYRVICNCNDINYINKYLDDILENNITQKARKNIKIKDIIFYKEFIFLLLILKKNKKMYIKLLTILKNIKNKSSK